MHIQSRAAMIVFNFVIGVLAALATWIQFSSFGNDAWRLLATWVALIAAIYYILNATAVLFSKRRIIGLELCPVLQGGLIVAGITLLLIRIVCYAMDSYLPSAGLNFLLIDLILPLLMIMSWVMFSIKGKWRVHDPFYWLAMLTAYFCAILASGEFMPRSARMIYPYEFLNYPSIGIDTMLWWLAIFAAVILIVGYIFWVLDFALSGKLSKCIVMPKIKTVVIEEEVEDEESEPEVVEKPEEKPVKLVTTGSRNLPVIRAQAAKKASTKPSSTQAKKTDKKSTTISSNSSQSKTSDTKKSSSKTEKPTKNTQTTANTAPVRIIAKINIADEKPTSEKPEQNTTPTSQTTKRQSEKAQTDKPQNSQPSTNKKSTNTSKRETKEEKS